MTLKFPGGNILQYVGQSRLKLFKSKGCEDTLASPLVRIPASGDVVEAAGDVMKTGCQRPTGRTVTATTRATNAAPAIDARTIRIDEVMFCTLLATPTAHRKAG